MTYTHKKGATLSLAGAVTSSSGGSVPNFLGTTITAQIRLLNDTLVDTLEATWLDVETRSVRVYKKDTSNWPVGVAEIDIKFTHTTSGEVLFTSTQAITILKGVTHA